MRRGKGLSLRVQCNGHTFSDLELALEEVLRLVREEYRVGSDRNDTGRYYFKVRGDEVDTAKEA